VKIKNSGMQKIDADLAFRYSDEKGVPVDFQREVAQELGLKIDEAGFEKFLKEQKERSRAKSKISKDIFAAPAGLARKKDEEWDEASKQKIRANHTATHLLHAALRRVLGEHAAQSGSLVYPQRLRFDFTHPKKTEKDEIAKIEELVNENIIAAQEVAKDIMSIDEARKSGAIALFGEKYADQVTVRTIGGFSKELCGGDHVKNTKEIRIFKVTQESSVSAGTRRIEAVTGDAVYEWILAQKENLRTRIADTLKTLDPGSELNKASAQKLQDMDKLISSKNKETVAYADIQKWETLEAEAVGLIERINAEKKKLQKAQSKENERALGPLAEQLTKNAKKTADVNIISGIVQNKDMAALRVLSDSIIKKTPSCVVLLGSGTAEKVNLVLAVSQDLIKKGLSSQELIKPIAACVGGSGGGRPEFAQAGGKEVSKLKEAITMIDNLIKEKLA
ncbi:MAG: DHHA1 domain-containing protein, partial [Candidatus Omnitrophica bacterium]|nr:DHHA1 domain-containing protein [Candidatus Omnitrophota bacterium]